MNWLPPWLWWSSLPLTGILAEESTADWKSTPETDAPPPVVGTWRQKHYLLRQRSHPSCHQSKTCQQLPVDTLRPTVRHQQNKTGLLFDICRGKDQDRTMGQQFFFGWMHAKGYTQFTISKKIHCRWLSSLPTLLFCSCSGFKFISYNHRFQNGKVSAPSVNHKLRAFSHSFLFFLVN